MKKKRIITFEVFARFLTVILADYVAATIAAYLAYWGFSGLGFQRVHWAIILLYPLGIYILLLAWPPLWHLVVIAGTAATIWYSFTRKHGSKAFASSVILFSVMGWASVVGVYSPFAYWLRP